MEGKGKAQERTKGERKPNERGKVDAGDEKKPDIWRVFDLDPPHGGNEHQH